MMKKAMKNIRAIILAAGSGTRLLPHTADKPKCMIELDGQTILQRQIEVLNSHGIEEIGIVCGHRANAIPDDYGLIKFQNRNYDKTNMLASLIVARDWIEEKNYDLIIAYGDIVYSNKVLSKLLNNHGSSVSIISDKNWQKYWQIRMENPLTDVESFKVDHNNHILELGKKPKTIMDVQGQYIGLQKWHSLYIKKIFSHYDALDQNLLYDNQPFRKMYMTTFIQTLINDGFIVKCVETKGGWLEFDTNTDYTIYKKMLKEGTLDQFYDTSENKK